MATAFGRELEAVRRAHMLTGEIGEAARLARDDRLGEAALHVMRPIRFMLATPVADAAEVMRRVGEEAWIEDKYDGIRAQLHVDAGGTVRLFSRDLNDVTRSFPEITEATAGLPDLGPLVIDGELVPWRQGSVLDFASLQTRLGRVRPSAELQAEVPVVLVAFDLLHHAGEDLIETPLRERRRRLEALSLPDRSGERLLLAHLASARSVDEVERHFDDARERRNEGLMIKDPDSTYQPGRRGLGWLKLKKALATLDCVVVGVEWGHGKRRGVLSDYTFAVRETDDPDARLLTIGKAYTGLTDAEIAEMTERFKAITLQDHGRYRTVVPEVVVEIAFDRIMRSARHRSGFAMRFPRIVRIRDDKSPAEIDTLATVEALFGEQASGRILLATGSGGETERIAATGEVEAAGERLSAGGKVACGADLEGPQADRGRLASQRWTIRRIRNGQRRRGRRSDRRVSNLRDDSDALLARDGHPQPAGRDPSHHHPRRRSASTPIRPRRWPRPPPSWRSPRSSSWPRRR